MKPKAAIGFIVIPPGRTLLRISMSRIQPIRARQPTRKTIAPAAWEKILKELTR
jgi:hypothetical protein